MEPLMVEMAVAETLGGKFYCFFHWANTERPVWQLNGTLDTPEDVRGYLERLREDDWHVKVMDVMSEHPALEDLI